MLSSSALPASRFLDAYHELLTFDEKAKCLGIQREFEVIKYPCFVLKYNMCFFCFCKIKCLQMPKMKYLFTFHNFITIYINLFQRLRQLSPVTEESQYVSAKIVRNRDKNRYSNVLPGATIVMNEETVDMQFKQFIFISMRKHLLGMPNLHLQMI